MQLGLTPERLHETLTAQEGLKRDFRVSDDALSMAVDEGQSPVLVAGEMKPMPITSNAHRQLSATLAIPKPYYNRCMESRPNLLATNVNAWLHPAGEEPKQRLLRTLGGKCRAVLSPGYRIIDNLPLLGVILPLLMKEMNMEVLSSHVGEDLFYLKVVHNDLQFDLASTGDQRDIVRAGLRFTNSETGRSRLVIERFFYRLVCLNGMTMESPFQRRHVGKRSLIEGDVEEVLSDDTKRLEDKALFAKIRDITLSSFDQAEFQLRARMLFDAKSDGIPRKKRQPVVKEVAQRMQITEGQSDEIYELLCQNSPRDGFTRFGVAQAVTELANDESIPYEAACKLERKGGRVIEMKPDEWRAIVDRAAA